MMTERKIVETINALQKSTEEYKDYVRNLPTEINKKQANQLILNSRNHRHIVNTHLAELNKLLNVLSPEEKKNEKKEDETTDWFKDMFTGKKGHF